MKYFALLFLLAVAGNSSGAKPEIRYFRYVRTVEKIPSTAQQACFAIDPAIFAHAAPRLADLRLYQGKVETPYALRLVAPVADAEQQIEPVNLGRRGGETVFDMAMPAGSYRDIQLAIAGKNFIATVEVSGSQAQTSALQTRIGSYTIFDLSREKLGRSTVLHLPTSDFRFLHFRIMGAVAPENLNGVSVLRVAESEPRYSTVATSTEILQKGRESVAQFTVPALTPVDRVVFIPGPSPVNFSREVEIRVKPVAPSQAGDSDEPQSPAESFGSLLRVHRVEDGHPINEERLNVKAPTNESATATDWTVTIENGDDTPIQLTSIRLEMVERDLCFHAAASDYSLYYGDSALAPPQYDYATLFTRQPDAARASTGPEMPNPVYEQRPDARPFTEKHPGLLWAVLVLVIALLAGVALRSAKRTSPNSQ